MSKIMRPKTPFEFCAYPVLKEALEKTNYNQTELAQSLGTSQFTVSAWVRGDRDATVRLLLALEDLTRMTFREIFCQADTVWGQAQTMQKTRPVRLCDGMTRVRQKQGAKPSPASPKLWRSNGAETLGRTKQNEQRLNVFIKI